MKVKNLQTFFKSASNEACYAACLIKMACDIAGVSHTLSYIGSALDIGIDRGYIKFNQDNYLDNNNFTVMFPCEWLKALTGKTFMLKLTEGDYMCDSSEREILFYAKTLEDATLKIGHFVLPDYDPTLNSNTVKVGKCYSKRVFRQL